MFNNTGKSERPIDTTMERLRQEFDRLLENVWSQGEKAMEVVGLRGGLRTWSPSIDIVETPDSVLVTADLPGIDPAQVEILLSGNMLTLKGERQLPEIPAEFGIHRRERTAGSFTRSFPLPVNVDPDQTVAEAKHGVLTITLAKLQPERPHQIKIYPKTSSASGESTAP